MSRENNEITLPIRGVIPMVDPFAAKDCALIAVATGEYVQTLRELKEKLAAIPTGCIYHHFWGGLLRPRFDDPE